MASVMVSRLVFWERLICYPLFWRFALSFVDRLIKFSMLPTVPEDVKTVQSVTMDLESQRCRGTRTY